MTPSFGKYLRALVLMLTVLAVAVGCSSSSSGGGEPSKAAATQAAATQAAATQAAAPSQASQPSQAAAGGGLAGAGQNFSKITSYKFKITMAGGSFGSLGSLVGGNADEIVMSGTIVTKPQKAASMDFGAMKIVEVDGKQWMDMGMGSWTEVPDSGSSSLVDSMAPEKLFSSTVSGSAADIYKNAGEGQKNGVQATHFVASSDEMKQYAGLMGVDGDADWTAEAWVAKDGGYPVSVSVMAKQGDKYAFKMVMDITNINDPANKVTAPA